MADTQDCSPSTLPIASVPPTTAYEGLETPDHNTATSDSDIMATTRLKVDTLLAKYSNVHNNNIQPPKVNSLVKSFSETPLPLSAKSFMTSSSHKNDERKSPLRQSQSDSNSLGNHLTNNSDDLDGSCPPIKHNNASDPPLDGHSNSGAGLDSETTSLTADKSSNLNSYTDDATDQNDGANDSRPTTPASLTAPARDQVIAPAANVKGYSRIDEPTDDALHSEANGSDITRISGSNVHSQLTVDCAATDAVEIASASASSATNPSSIFSAENEMAAAHTDGHIFCLTCHEHIKSEEMHNGHQTVPVSTAIANQTADCDAILAESTKYITGTEQWREHISTLRADLVKTRKSIAVELDEMFREIEHRLQERKMALFTQLTDCTYDKECYLDEQLQYMDRVHKELSDISTSVHQVKEELTDTNLIALNCHRLQESSLQLQSQTDCLNSYSLSKNSHVQFDRHGIPEVRRALNHLAAVSSSNVVPSRCVASGDGVTKAHVNKQTFVKVTPRNAQAQLERGKGLVLEAQLYNKEVNVECQCIDNANGTYNVLYIAPEAGHYKLCIKLFNQHIKGSPYNVNVVPGARVTFSKSTNAYELKRVHQHHNSPSQATQISKHSSPRISSPRSVSSAESFSSLKILPTSPNSHSAAAAIQPPYGDYLALIGQYGRKKGDFSNPQGVTMDHNSRIYCTDSTNQNIQMFTDTGSYINVVGKRGRQTGQLLRPIGICCSKDGCLLFTDYENKCINVFKDGSFIRRIGQGKLIGPKGITTTPRGSVVVADNKGNQVLEFSINGRLLRKIQSVKNDKATHFAGPHYVAVSQSGDIFVSDFHNHCVKVFNKDGGFLRSFGQHGAGNGQFNAPTGLSIDQSGHVLVSDWGNSRIQIFDEEGSFLAHVDTSAAPLFGPQSIHATRDNKVIVADSGNHCVKVFRYDIL